MNIKLHTNPQLSHQNICGGLVGMNELRQHIIKHYKSAKLFMKRFCIVFIPKLIPAKRPTTFSTHCTTLILHTSLDSMVTHTPSSFLEIFIHCCHHRAYNYTTVCARLPMHTSDIHVNNTSRDTLHTVLISFPRPPCTCHSDAMTRSQTSYGTPSKSEQYKQLKYLGGVSNCFYTLYLHIKSNTH